MSSSKITSSKVTSAYERWELPLVEDEYRPERYDKVTASELQGIQKQAYDEGYAQGCEQGFNKGLAEGQTELSTRVQQLDTLLHALNTPFEELDSEVVQQVSELAMLAARQLVRRELHADPVQVIAVVSESINLLPVNSRNISVYLHPDDAVLVRDAFSLVDETENPSHSWRIVEEPLITRGGCRVSSENSNIDATVETRLNRLIASVLGGERAHDGQ